MANILVVDDLAANRQVLVALLKFQGHEPRQAGDGAEALAAVRKNPPHLVITDVLMPTMDGFEFVRQLRLDPELAHVPVVFCTSHYGEDEARMLAWSGGVADVLTKPIDSDEVLSVVERVLSRASAKPTSHLKLAEDFDREHLRLVTDKLSEQDKDLRTANARLRALVNIGLELASERESERLLHTVCATARDLFGATYVTLGIVDRNSQRVQHCVAFGASADITIELGRPAPGFLGQVVAERRPRRGRNPGGDPAALQLGAGHPDVHAYLAAPIVSPAHVYGWLCLIGNEGRAFTEDDEQLVRALAGQVGRIYENGYVYSIAQKRAEALEREVAERTQAEAALLAERNRTQRYLDTAEVILLALDLDGRVTSINRYGCLLLGRSAGELVGRDWIETCVPDRLRGAARERLKRLMAGDLSVIQTEVIGESGTPRLIEWRNTLLRDESGAVIGALGSGTDVTERHALEAQYYQAQKMEAIGRLAGGVAHDFNNLLTAILGYCELLLLDINPTDPRYGDIAEIERAGRQAAGLTRQLLAFSRKQIIEPAAVDLNAVLLDLRKMLERLIGEDVQVDLALCSETVVIDADRGQIEQVILNLAVNARDAMPKGGRLTIETANVELDEHYATKNFAVIPGSYVALIVTDNGMGMTEDVQSRLFEPFFTTKEPGKGTGLGLATVHGIVTRYKGSIHVYSELNRGTSFKLYFPSLVGAPTAAIDTAPKAPAPGTQTVLLVEDADALRALTTRLLQRLGYTVLVADNADDAMHFFDRHPSIDVVLTDVVMPGVSGPDLARRLVERNPALKVIFMSGYTEETIVHHGVLNPGITFLNKPFTSETLSRKLREVLGG